MARVDPYVVKIPVQIVDLKTGEHTREFADWLKYDNRWKQMIWIRSGGGDDAIEDSGVREFYPWPLNELEEEGKEFTYPSLPILPKSFNAVTTDSNYTAVAFDFVNAKSGATIKFPKFPDENDVIIIRNGDGTLISLDGNGKTMNGSSTGKLFKKETTINFHYFIDSDEWFAK